MWCEGIHSQLRPLERLEVGESRIKPLCQATWAGGQVLRASKLLIVVLGREIFFRVGLFVLLSLPVARPVQSRFLWLPEHLAPSSFPTLSPFPLEEWLREVESVFAWRCPGAWQLGVGRALLPLWPFALLGWEEGSGRTGHLPLAPEHWGLEMTRVHQLCGGGHC